MTGKARTPAAAKSTAKLFMHGLSQAVRLPKAYRFEGDEVRVSKVGDKVILEPLEKPPFDVEAWYARMDALGGADFLPDGPLDDPPFLKPLRKDPIGTRRARRQGSFSRGHTG
jgi:antitoxin VapB